MRNLAAEAECAIGLPYTVFPNREALVSELVALELTRIREQVGAWSTTAGTRAVGENLDRYATLLLDADAPSLELARSLGDASVDSAVIGSAHASGLSHSFEHAVAEYLLAEQRLGRVAPDVDVEAFGFVITGAIHNLVDAGAAFPRPSRKRLRRFLLAVADRIVVAG